MSRKNAGDSGNSSHCGREPWEAGDPMVASRIPVLLMTPTGALDRDSRTIQKNLREVGESPVSLRNMWTNA